MRKKVILTSLLLLALIATGCKQKGSGEREVVIFAVNDIHAEIDNFPRLAFMVDSLRAIYPDLLLVSGGDNQTGNPVNDQYPSKGLPMIELMNALDFDLSAVGNHEFDVGPKALAHHTQVAKYTHLCANLTAPEGQGFEIKPYEIVTFPNGLKVAFTSVLDLNPDGLPACHPSHVQEFAFSDPIESTRQYLYLRDEADLLVMINHYGFENDVKLANSLPAGAVDLIIGGHSHTKVDTEQIHNGILITQAESKLKYGTLIHLKVKDKGEVTSSAELLPVGREGNTKPEIQAMVDQYNDSPALNEVIATAPFPLADKEQIGYWMADALKGTAHTDFAVINRGGVRVNDIPAGDITRKTILTTDPFGNAVVTLTITGHELKEFLASMNANDKYGIMYPAGFQIKYYINEETRNLERIELLHENGTPLNMDKKYSLATNSYIISTAHFEREDPGQALAISTAEGWMKWLQEEAPVVQNYAEVKRVYINE